ncbi:MAG: hypothetical protein V5B60_05440 [Accumulibacter sp.]|jgi:hypothetical protein|uniref:hypothetical protein n=1 Tax=Accumulibacter sp. TaxID=2053492 RepID=UPI002FC374B4
MKSQPATTNVSPARTVKISRQPASCSATSSGAVAASAPSPPEVMIQAGQRSLSLGRKAQRKSLERGHQAGGYAEAAQSSPDGQPEDSLAHGEGGGTGGGDQEERRLHPACPETVEQHAQRHAERRRR